ncbi:MULTISPECIES: VOC family protein [Pseudarthrobacter]|jgi:predicted enzyme related to lactoylglutathione lyase|uniref:Glyoxalase n=1 Tax=Pseudarthrobacter polychromogenes TaxID=1676 RepID=A0ABQ1XDF8_9MICC|nr:MULTISPECIES: VOC family protein [Pseudarthrobacter]MBA4101616.1 glyoxalase [Arthrobacter sp.]MBD1537608.1 VOC family protein [Arthrobacter sp. S13_S34]WHP61482.1 VOC family protein [Arthrobacter sp. KFRI-F3372]NSX36205.1 VOC family protein [Pseudarthrobacter oxydans]BFE44907.1 VOC family protein [Pseudarthrobacter oxydans]
MGGVVHFEIPADDQERAKKFYQQALGWRIEPVPGMDYNMVITTPMDEATGQPTTAGAINGGMMAREEKIANPVITVDVPDIDATLKTVEELGGSVVMPKNEIPGMGYFAYFKDPEDNVMGLWENLPADQQAQSAG